MASNILSRLLPSATDGPSEYEPMGPPARRSNSSGREHRVSSDLDEENLRHHFVDQNLDELLREASDSRITTESTAFLPENNQHNHRLSPPSRRRERYSDSPRWNAPQTAVDQATADDDDDVPPESLLMETERGRSVSAHARRHSPQSGGRLPPPIPGPSTRRTTAQWEATMAQQRLHKDTPGVVLPMRHGFGGGRTLFTDPREKAMWRWNNVHELDRFFTDVYNYFKFHGIWSIVLSRLIRMLTLAFMVAFTTFLLACVDQKKIPGSKKMSDIVIPKCTQNIHGVWNVVLWIFAVAWVYKLFEYVLDMRRLWNLHDFYHYLLDIPDSDIQSVTWQLVVKRLMDLRDANPSTASNLSPEHRKFLGTQSRQRMDAHDIANRLMRRENYLIALFNKDILDLTVPVPFLGRRQFFSRAVEWYIYVCVMNFVFDEREQVKSVFLTDRQRKDLIDRLRQRFKYGALSSCFAVIPLCVYFCVSYAYRYFAEFYKDPAQLGARTFTPYAEWKFREFNELSHLFERRRTLALKPASLYLQQFPKDKMDQLFDFAAFVCGSVLLPLALWAWLHAEVAVNFEITPGKNVVFWLGALGGIYVVARSAVSRNSLPEDDTFLDAETALLRVTDYTHYCPASWNGRLHSDEVRRDFSALYKMKLLLFVDEMVSLIATPWVLWVSLPRSSERIVDFFREFTIHVDGLGHVCSFAVFDFQRPGENVVRKPHALPEGPILGNQPRRDDGVNDPSGLRDDYYAAKDNKLMASFYGFKDQYGTNPPSRHRPQKGHVQKQRYPYRQQQHHQPNPSTSNQSSNRGQASDVAAAMRRAPALSSGRHPQQSRRSASGPQSHQQRLPSSPLRADPGLPISPIQSILLDPHHQPTNDGMPLSPGWRAQRGSPRRAPTDEAIVEETEKEAVHEDSQLGDSWRTSRAGMVDDGSSGADDDGADKGAGVLGLLHNLRKVQRERRVPGVGL